MKKIILLLSMFIPLLTTGQSKLSGQIKDESVTEAKQLKEVSVSYRKPVIERKADRVTFHVENSIIASGGSAWEALTNTPGVQVSSGDQITANRKDVQIYMDGKPLNLAGEDLSAYLQGLPSDLIAQVEVFSNPPARFEAQGSSLINIITKKARKAGLNGTLNSGFTQGIYSGYNASSSFNYRKDKLNVYGSYGFTQRKNFQDHDSYIDFGDSFWNTPNRTISGSNNHNYRLGADYQLSANQVVGFQVTGSNRAGSSWAKTTTEVRSKAMLLDSSLTTGNTSTGSGNAYAYNINYNLKLDSGKTGVNIDLDYAPFKSTSDAAAENRTSLPDGTPTPSYFNIRTPSSQQIEIYSGKADYNYGFGSWTASSGLKYSSTQSRNDFQYYNRVGSSLEAVAAHSNYFVYNEKTAAAYTSVSREIDQWTFQAGLRAEYTNTRGNSVTLHSLTKNNYLKLFPTLFIQYKANEDHQLQFNYAYRIERPEYNRLNPARRFNSPYNIYVGNPALQPAFVQNFEFTYAYKQQYSVTGFYNTIQDQFSNINVQDNTTKIYYGTHDNLGRSVLTGLRISASAQALDWWNMDLFGNVYYQQEKSGYLSGSYNYKIYSYDATLKQSFTIDSKSGMKAELNAGLNGPGIQGIYKVESNSKVDAGIKMNMLKGNGTLHLVVNDIFNTNYYLIHIDYLDQRSTSRHHSESRNASLSFTYRFGKNVVASRNRKTASEEERSRAK